MPKFDNKNSVFRFEQRLNSLNEHILYHSNNSFDLGNFVDTSFNISTENILGVANRAVLPQAKSFIDDELRTQITSLLKDYKTIPPEVIPGLLKKILKRNVLYIGSECEREGFIGIDAEYDDLLKVLKSEYMELTRVANPTIKSLMKDWEKYKPSIIFISCHGLPFSLFLQDEQGNCKEYNNTDLVSFFKQRSLYTECVILSACESLALGKLITETCKNVICVNRMVNIMTARTFCNVFMEYLNDHSLQNASVYEEGFKYSRSYVNYESLPDAFAFEYLQADLIGN